jgi:hypothetical protein
MLWKFSSVYDPKLQLADHAQPVKCEMRPGDAHAEKKIDPRDLYVHKSVTRLRATDEETEAFVVETGGRPEPTLK